MSRTTDAEGNKSTEAEISIYDQIGGWGITANEFIHQLKELGDVDTINLRIASGGGSIVEGNTIFNALKRHSARVVTHIDSLAASMASVIAMAGDEIRMAENALLMIHNPWTASIGGAEQLRKDADLLDKMEANIRASYARSTLSAEELDKAMAAETFYTAEEAKEFGFIDHIEGANLAAASIGDSETLKELSIEIPQAKFDAIKMECQSRQIGKLIIERDEAKGELDVEREKVIIAESALSDAKADLAKAEEATAKLVEDHAEALAKSEEATAKKIADHAAELLAADGTPPIETVPEAGQEPSNQKMTREQFWEAYHEFDARGDLEGKNEFYAENKHVIGQ